MKFAPHIKRLSERYFYQLRQLCSIRRSLNISSMKTLVNAFVTNRVDYCNRFFSGTGAVHLRLIQSVLNAAACLIVTKRKYDVITLTIRDDLHWLPVWQRLEYKICVLVYKCLHRSAPSYLSSICANVGAIEVRRHLRSAAHGDLIVPRTTNKTYGPRSFTVFGPST